MCSSYDQRQLRATARPDIALIGIDDIVDGAGAVEESDGLDCITGRVKAFDDAQYGTFEP